MLAGVYETPEEIAALQRLLDDSAHAAGAHLRGIITPSAASTPPTSASGCRACACRRWRP
jgi:hypothetical protein